jgi:heme exporter protein C
MRTLSFVTVAAFFVSLALVFFYAPNEADQGFVQKIFYIHVPMAIVALCGFVIAGAMAVMHLRTRDPRWDMRSYVAIHLSLIFAVGTLITGSIWARASWGHWWVWSEPTLVSFLIVFLLYATYQPLRFAIEDPERQARFASVFAITAGCFVPLNFIAVRLSTAYLHPRVLGETSNLPAKMALTFYLSLIAMALLFATLWKFEMTAKHARAQLRTLKSLLAGDDPFDAWSGAGGRSAAPRLTSPGMVAASASTPAAAGTPASATGVLSPSPTSRLRGS